MRALAWATVWARFAERARLHLGSLDSRTDWEAILRWYCRWLRALERTAEAVERADTPACFRIDPSHPIAVALVNGQDVLCEANQTAGEALGHGVVLLAIDQGYAPRKL